MDTLASKITKQHILTTLDELPSESLPIVEQFVNFLQAQVAKTQARQARGQIPGLGGLWQDFDFDVDIEDIRRLRHELTQAVNRRVGRYDPAN
jgi:hypothetical protein